MASNLFGMMNTSTTGLMASQIAISVTGNNIAKSDIDGYTRQRVTLGTNGAIHYRGVGYLGTGVSIKDVQRIRDQHLDSQIRNETSKMTEYETKKEVYSELENIFNEPSENGLNQMLTNMWNSWEELSKNGESSTMNSLVQQNSQIVAEQFNNFTIQLSEMKKNIDSRQEAQVTIAADLISQINEMNEFLETAYRNDPTKTPNELLDQRDALTKQLSELMPIEVTYNKDHTISVSAQTNKGAVEVLELDAEGVGALVPELKTGSLKGFDDMRNEVDNYQNKINQLSKSLATSINKVHEAAGGKPIFNFDEANPAGTITINPELDKIVAGTSGGADGSVALEILGLRDSKVSIDGEEVKFGDYYKDLIGDLGVGSKYADTMIAGQTSVLKALNQRYESVSGVSIDEEVTNLVQFQKAYEANAKVMATITEMLDTIINKLGV